MNKNKQKQFKKKQIFQSNRLWQTNYKVQLIQKLQIIKKIKDKEINRKLRMNRFNKIEMIIYLRKYQQRCNKQKNQKIIFLNQKIYKNAQNAINILDKINNIISGKIYCKDCLKCSICKKLIPVNEIILNGSKVSHKYCQEIKKNESELKVGILQTIKKKHLKSFGCVNLQPDGNYFTCISFECIEFKNYLNYVVGYHNFLVNDNFLDYPEYYRVLKSEAERFLIEDFQNAEDKVSKLLIENGKKISDINENVLMLFISAAFIFREEYLIKPLFISVVKNNYNQIYLDLEEFNSNNKKNIIL